MVFNNNDDSGSNLFLPFAGVTGGAIYGGLDFYRQNGSPFSAVSRAHQIPGATGMAIRDTMPSSVMGGATSVADITSDIDRLGQRLPSAQARAVVDEAMRASLAAGRRVPVTDIDSLSRRVGTATRLRSNAAVQGVFEIATDAVMQHGDPMVFRKRLKDYAEGRRDVGARFTAEELTMLNPNVVARGNPSGVRKWLGTGSTADAMRRLQGIAPAEADLAASWLSRMPQGYDVNAKIADLPGPMGSGERMRMMRFSVNSSALGDPFSFDLPLTQGSTRSGKYFGSLYTTPEVMMFETGERLSFGEHGFRRMANELEVLRDGMSQLSQPQMRNRLRQVASDLAEIRTWTPSFQNPGQQVINQLNREMMYIPDLPKGLQVDAALSSMYESQRVWPAGHPAQVAAGKVRKYDPRRVWAGGELFPMARKPVSWSKPYSPTERALGLLERPMGPGGAFTRGEPFLMTEELNQMALERGQRAPQLGVAYATPGGSLEKALRARNVAEENLLVRKKLMPMFETYDIREKVISTKDYMGMSKAGREEIMRGVTKGQMSPVSLQPGQLIGYGPDTLEEITAAKTTGLREKIVGAEMFGKDGIKLAIQRTHSPEWYVKTFGMLKTTTRAREDAYLNAIADDIGVPFLKSGVDGFTYADELLKNRSFLRQQMQSGLAVMAADAIKAGSLKGAALTEAQAFLDGGLGWASRNAATEGAVLRKAMSWGLDVGPIGGMLPAAKGKAVGRREYYDILREATGGGDIRPLAAQLRASPYVVGMETSFVGAHRYSGGGGMPATMEPRGILQLMQAKWMTPKGENAAHLLAGDILDSMSGFGEEMTEMRQMIGTMGGKGTPEGIERIAVGDLNLGRSPMSPGAISQVGKPGGYIKPYGYFMDVGRPVEAFGGATGVYVPGYKSMRGMELFRVAGEQGSAGLMATDLMGDIHRFARSATGADTAAGRALMEEAAQNLYQSSVDVMSAAVAGRSGGGSAGGLRGPMKNSLFLAPSAIEAAPGQALAPNVVELSRSAVDKMYLGSIEKNATLAAQYEQLLAGERVPTMVGRHGLFGPYRMQPVWAQLAQDARGAGEDFIRVATNVTEDLMIGGKKVMDVPVTPLLGLHGDLDDDRFITKTIGDKKAARATEELLAAGGFSQDYRQWAAETAYRTKMVKGQGASRVITKMTDIERIIRGSMELRVGVGQELSQLSLGLSEARMAMFMHGDPQKAQRFFSMAEILEENLLMAKHGTATNMGAEVANALKGINQEVNFKSLTDTMDSVFGLEAQKDVTMKLASENGKVMEWTMKGVRPDEFWGDVRGALNKFRTGPEKILYENIIRGAKEGTKVPVNQMAELIDQAARGEIDSLGYLGMRDMKGVAASSSQVAISRVNKGIREIGGMVKRSFGKPMLWGLGLATAAAMFMGPPDANPMTPPIPPARGGNSDTAGHMSGVMASGYAPQRDLRPESMPVPGGVQGQPTMAGMPSQEMYMTNSPALNERTGGNSYDVYGEGANVDSQALQRALASAVPGARGNITLNDYRRKLTAQNMSDMMEGF